MSSYLTVTEFSQNYDPSVWKLHVWSTLKVQIITYANRAIEIKPVGFDKFPSHLKQGRWRVLLTNNGDHELFSEDPHFLKQVKWKVAKDSQGSYSVKATHPKLEPLELTPEEKKLLKEHLNFSPEQYEKEKFQELALRGACWSTTLVFKSDKPSLEKIPQVQLLEILLLKLKINPYFRFNNHYAFESLLLSPVLIEQAALEVFLQAGVAAKDLPLAHLHKRGFLNVFEKALKEGVRHTGCDLYGRSALFILFISAEPDVFKRHLQLLLRYGLVLNTFIKGIYTQFSYCLDLLIDVDLKTPVKNWANLFSNFMTMVDMGGDVKNISWNTYIALPLLFQQQCRMASRFSPERLPFWENLSDKLNRLIDPHQHNKESKKITDALLARVLHATCLNTYTLIPFPYSLMPFPDAFVEALSSTISPLTHSDDVEESLVAAFNELKNKFKDLELERRRLSR